MSSWKAVLLSLTWVSIWSQDSECTLKALNYNKTFHWDYILTHANTPFRLYRLITYEFQHSVFSFSHRSVVQQPGLGHSHVNQNHKRSAQIPQWNRSRKILSLIWFHPTGYAHTSLIEFLHVQNFLGPGKNINLYMIHITNHIACWPFLK